MHGAQHISVEEERKREGHTRFRERSREIKKIYIYNNIFFKIKDNKTTSL